jgi:transcriptional regulator with XRE-family HTH domain
MLRLRYERQRKGMSQQSLGFHAGVGAAEISRIENGWLRPTPSIAKRLADVLELPPEDLLQEIAEAHV